MYHMNQYEQLQHVKNVLEVVLNNSTNSTALKWNNSLPIYLVEAALKFVEDIQEKHFTPS